MWHKVPDYPGTWVTKCGRVMCDRRGEVTPTDNGKGYLYVRVTRTDGKSHTQGVHRLVLMTFAGPPEGRQGAHINGKRGDNRIENLRWATPKENTLDKLDHGTWFHSTTISQREKCGLLRAQGYTYRQISKMLGISVGYAHRLVHKGCRYQILEGASRC